MDVVNATNMLAGYTIGLDPDGRERLVVVVKGTFTLSDKDTAPQLADEQAPLVMADEFFGEPGLSAIRYESDFAPVKPRCDVIINGTAHAPGGRAADRVRVSLSVGSVKKSFDVVGDRIWDGRHPTRPEPFTTKAIHYGCAYGGSDAAHDEPDRQLFYSPNPIGVGYYPLSRGADLRGKPLPNTEEQGRPVDSATGRFQPMAFGPMGRNFQWRIRFAGTYDQDWQDNVFPFLPADFDTRYYQCAPEDQLIDHPSGNEEIELVNLTPGGRLRLRLPAIDIPVEFTDESYARREEHAALDTIVIEPDTRRLILCWRASHPLRRNLLEMRQLVVGRMTRAWYRARELGKTYYRSLADIPAREDIEEP